MYIIGKVYYGKDLTLLHNEHGKVQQLGIIPNKVTIANLCILSH
jgi:hypothetical protein